MIWELSIILQMMLVSLFIQTIHPLYLSLLVIMAALVVGNLVAYMISSWLFLSLVLIFLGGMMVIFLYFTSLQNNEKLDFSVSKNFLVVFFFCYILISVKTLGMPNFSMKFNFSFFNLYVNVLFTVYLLLTLFIVVKITENFKGSVEMAQF